MFFMDWWDGYALAVNLDLWNSVTMLYYPNLLSMIIICLKFDIKSVFCVYFFCGARTRVCCRLYGVQSVSIARERVRWNGEGGVRIPQRMCCRSSPQTIDDDNYHLVSPESNTVLLLDENAGGRRKEVFSVLANGSYAICHISLAGGIICSEHRKRCRCEHRWEVEANYFEEVTLDSSEDSDDDTWGSSINVAGPEPTEEDELREIELENCENPFAPKRFPPPKTLRDYGEHDDDSKESRDKDAEYDSYDLGEKFDKDPIFK